jgi:peroxiredoxin
MKKLVISMLLTGLVICSPTIVGFAAAAETAPKVGSEAPALELSNLDGKAVSLQSYKENKKVILTFFASWSKSCQEELKALQALYTEKKNKLEILAVSFDKKTKDLKAYLSKADLSYPVLHDKKLSSIDAFQILIIPTTFCINREGVIEKIFVDYDDNVNKALEDWLNHS